MGRTLFRCLLLRRDARHQLSKLDKPDVQLLKKQLDDAFAQGKKLTRVQNYHRECRTSTWFTSDEQVTASIEFTDIMSGDSAFLRFK